MKNGCNGIERVSEYLALAAGTECQVSYTLKREVTDKVGAVGRITLAIQIVA